MTDLEFREQTATAPNLRSRGSTPEEASTRLAASPGLLDLTDDGTPTTQTSGSVNNRDS